MAHRKWRMASKVSDGSQSSNRSLAFSPAKISNQAIDFEPPKVLSTAASRTFAGGLPDVGPDAVAFDERDDRTIGDVELAVLPLDLLSVGGRRHVIEADQSSSLLLKDERDCGMSVLAPPGGGAESSQITLTQGLQGSCRPGG